MSDWKNRIVAMEQRDPKTLVPNPENWRLHPKQQRRAMEGALDELGWVAPVVLNQRSGRLIDGHMRLELALANAEATVPVLVVDLSDNEERVALASLDPLGDMAGRGRAELWRSIVGSLTIENAALQSTLADLVGPAPEVEPNAGLKNWSGLPEEAVGAHRLIVHFETEEDMTKFSELIGQKINKQTKFAWYPEVDHE
jgi:hypothetical protein